MECSDFLVGATLNKINEVDLDESCLFFDFFEGEIDMEFEGRIKLTDEELSGGVDVGNSVNKRVQVFADDGVGSFPEEEFKGKGLLDVYGDLDESE